MLLDRSCSNTDPEQLCCDGYSILYQRGIYPPDNFEQKKQYGLSIMVSTDTGLSSYLSTVLEQMSGMTSARLAASRKHCALSLLCRLAGAGRAAEDGLGHHKQ